MRVGAMVAMWPYLVALRLPASFLVLPSAEAGRLLLQHQQHQQAASSSGVSAEIPLGAEVRLTGLQKQRELNGETGHVQAFDRSVDRYEVWLPDHGAAARIHPANLELVEIANDMTVKAHGQAALQRRGDRADKKGEKVVLGGLTRSRSLNGKVGTVEGFDAKQGRYLVRVGDTLKRVRPENMKPAGTAYLERGFGVDRSDPGADDAEAIVREAEREADGEVPEGAAAALAAEPVSQQAHYQAGATTPPPQDRPVEAQPIAAQPADAQPVAAWSADVSDARPASDTTPRQSHAGRTERGHGHRRQKSHGGAAVPAANTVVAGARADATTEVEPPAAAAAVPGAVAASEWRAGDMAKLVGLKSTHASSLNGALVVVQGYDQNSKRYVVQMPTGGVKRVKAEHLERVSSSGTTSMQPAADASEDDAHVTEAAAAAAAVVAEGGEGAASSSAPTEQAQRGAAASSPSSDAARTALPAAPLAAPATYVPRPSVAAAAASATGVPLASTPALGRRAASATRPEGAAHLRVGQAVRARDNASEAWKRGRVTSVEPELRVRPDMWKEDFKFKIVEPVAEASPPPQLSVCNAYTGQTPLQVLAISQGSTSRYSQVVHDLDFQSCADIQSLPFKLGALSVVIGRLEVARVTLNSTDQPSADHGLELTVYRADANSLKATVHENTVKAGEAEDGAYYLHLVDAYAGGKLLELKAKRGSFERKLPLGATYRLKKEEPIHLTLTDGFQRLQLGFQPHKGHTYTVAATGADIGLKGEPRNVGLVAHEVGAWTAAEQMPDMDAAARTTLPVMQAAQMPSVAVTTQEPVAMAVAMAQPSLRREPEPEGAELVEREEASDGAPGDEAPSDSSLSWISSAAHRLLR